MIDLKIVSRSLGGLIKYAGFLVHDDKVYRVDWNLIDQADVLESHTIKLMRDFAEAEIAFGLPTSRTPASELEAKVQEWVDLGWTRRTDLEDLDD